MFVYFVLVLFIYLFVYLFIYFQIYRKEDTFSKLKFRK